MKKVFIDRELKTDYGDIKIAYLFVEGISVAKTPPREKKLARSVENDLREKYNENSLNNNYYLNEWFRLAEKLGIKDEEFLPAQIGLIKNILLGKNIHKVNNIVDAGNIISAKYFSPVGIFDYDKINSDIILRVSGNYERYLPMFSNSEIEVPNGEIVYSDGLGIFSRYSKDADRTKITDETTSLFCVIDGTANIERAYLAEALDELAMLLMEVGGEGVRIISKTITT